VSAALAKTDHPNFPWWQVFADAIDKLPLPQQPSRLAGLALEIKARGDRGPAKILALRASKLARDIGDPTDIETARRALSAVVPNYHVQISTDALRIAAWQASLKDLLRPGMLALEIGAGSGILTMLAAQTGAEVVACENDPVLAAIAEEVVRHNGLAERIRIVGKPVEELRLGEDLPRPADLLLLDLFGNRLFDFEPFEIIRFASQLLRPGAAVVPMRASLVAALADFQRWHRIVPGEVAGFDLGPLLDLTSMRRSLDPADPDLTLRSAAVTMVSADLPGDMPAPSGEVEHMLVSDGGRVNGVALWLRLELAPGQVLEARPGLAPFGFYASVNFYAFADPHDTTPGELCTTRLGWKGKEISLGRGGGEARKR